MTTDAAMADRIALQDVMLRYAAGVDERDFVMYQSCFADDVEVVDFARAPIIGVGAWLAFVRTALEQYGATQHLLGPTLATLNGDRAHGRTDVQALHYLKSPEGERFILWATYETDFARVNGDWKITHHRLVPRGTQRS